MWEPTEVAHFFEALKTHGRNFDLVSAFIVSKNREQVRHFYYRLVKKIKLVLEKEQNIDFKVKENILLTVLCFGDIWKANAHSSEKAIEILSFHLSPPILSSFKNMTLKVISKANISEKLELQLLPKNNINSDWLKQKGFNPRLILKLKANKPVSFVINHLVNKWGIDNQTNLTLYLPNNDVTWYKITEMTLFKIYQYLDNPKPFQLYYYWKLAMENEKTNIDNETFLSSFYVQKHKLPVFQEHCEKIKFNNQLLSNDNSQLSTVSMSAFSNDISSDGFGYNHGEEQSCKQFYHAFENSNDEHGMKFSTAENKL